MKINEIIDDYIPYDVLTNVVIMISAKLNVWAGEEGKFVHRDNLTLFCFDGYRTGNIRIFSVN